MNDTTFHFYLFGSIGIFTTAAASAAAFFSSFPSPGFLPCIGRKQNTLSGVYLFQLVFRERSNVYERRVEAEGRVLAMVNQVLFAFLL